MENKITNLHVVKGERDTVVTEAGGISMGRDGVIRFRLLTIKNGMEFEAKTAAKGINGGKGMKLTRGPSCFTIAKREFGFKGNKQKVYEQFCAHCGFDAAVLPGQE